MRGLSDFPEREWPDNIELLYYAFHVMAGLGTLLIARHGGRERSSRGAGRSRRSAPMLWVLMLAFPFPYIADTAGWMTAELGRQPWLVYGLLRTAQGSSPNVHAGTALFTLIGFCGLYSCSALLFAVPRRPRDRARARLGARGGGPWLSSGSRIVVLMLTAYVVLDGFDLGAGALHLFVATHRRRAAPGARRDRPVLGRQRGLAAGGRRRAVRRRSRACWPSGSPASTSRSSSCSGA